MSNYIRVLPRDLFNEASLLKCYGRLWILLDETADHGARFETSDVDVFDIAQDASSGAITVRNVTFTVRDIERRLTRPLNSRRAWPLYVESDDDDIAVFDDAGNLSDEMRAFIQHREPADVERL